MVDKEIKHGWWAIMRQSYQHGYIYPISEQFIYGSSIYNYMMLFSATVDSQSGNSDPYIAVLHVIWKCTKSA